MTKLQMARVELWKALEGKVIPKSVLKNMENSSDAKTYQRFCEIYADNKSNLILAANALNEDGFVSFWSEVYPGDRPDYDLIAFLLSGDFSKLKIGWRNELSCLIVGVGETTNFDALQLIGNMLFFNGSDRIVEEWFAKLVKKLSDMEFDFNVYLAYCLIAFKFNLMTENLLPEFFKAFEKHKDDFANADMSLLN